MFPEDPLQIIVLGFLISVATFSEHVHVSVLLRRCAKFVVYSLVNSFSRANARDAASLGPASCSVEWQGTGSHFSRAAFGIRGGGSGLDLSP